MKYFRRTRELQLLSDFAESKKSEFMYVRGRRRVGKSWLLNEFSKQRKNRFLFSGLPDSTSKLTMKAFVNKWLEFSNDPFLSEIKASVLDWNRIFTSLTDYAVHHNRLLILIFDEIQWICKETAGFAGALKEAWVSWQKTLLNKINFLLR